VYCSSTLALAALETLVHIGLETNLKFVSFAVEIPEFVAVEYLKRHPRGWRQEPPIAASMRVGSTWLRNESTVALIVPSVLVPAEWNALLNPAHPDFAKLKISRPKPFSFDPRMWK
jgi:RES domain-containing protein